MGNPGGPTVYHVPWALGVTAIFALESVSHFLCSPQSHIFFFLLVPLQSDLVLYKRRGTEDVCILFNQVGHVQVTLLKC